VRTVCGATQPLRDEADTTLRVTDRGATGRLDYDEYGEEEEEEEGEDIRVTLGKSAAAGFRKVFRVASYIVGEAKDDAGLDDHGDVGAPVVVIV
jgi:hypothetical protein